MEVGAGARRAAQGTQPHTLLGARGSSGVRTLARPAAGRGLAEIARIKAPKPTYNSRWASSLSGP